MALHRFTVALIALSAIIALSITVALLSFSATQVWTFVALLELSPLIVLCLLCINRAFRSRLKILIDSARGLRQTSEQFSDLTWLLKILSLIAIPALIGMFPIALVLSVIFQWDIGSLQERMATVVFIWFGLNLYLAYVLAIQQKFAVSIVLSCWLAICALHSTASGLSIKKGVLRLFMFRSPFAPASILAYALCFSGAFGAIHFNLWRINPSAYSGMHDWQDSIYFSIVTLATVGYGDITPLSHLARWACSIEIVLGFIILVAALNATMSVWSQRTQAQTQSNQASTLIHPGETATRE